MYSPPHSLTLDHCDNFVTRQELQLNTVKVDDGEDPAMRSVRLLENRLEKALTKHNEALAIHKTYTLIAKRLREERIGFNNQVCGAPRLSFPLSPPLLSCLSRPERGTPPGPPRSSKPSSAPSRRRSTTCRSWSSCRTRRSTPRRRPRWS